MVCSRFKRVGNEVKLPGLSYLSRKSMVKALITKDSKDPKDTPPY